LTRKDKAFLALVAAVVTVAIALAYFVFVVIRVV
jgi:hypothetical protein